MEWGRPESEDNTAGKVTRAADVQPSDEDVVSALADIERASRPPDVPASSEGPIMREPARAPGRQTELIVIIFVTAAIFALLVAAHRYGARLRQIAGRSAPADAPYTLSTGDQANAENLLQRALSGDASAAVAIHENAADWTGRTHRTPRIDQLITAGLNAADLKVRAASLEVQLAVDGVPATAAGFQTLAAAVGNPQRRAWALWMLGALGNRGVDPEHAAKVAGSYLSDPNPNVRAAAVEALGLIASEETVPLLLERFRSDPSLLVQERAACNLAESGMYTHAQRVQAAGIMIGWLDDPLLSAQQKGWVLQALHDVSGKSLGASSEEWRQWYASGQ